MTMYSLAAQFWQLCRFSLIEMVQQYIDFLYRVIAHHIGVRVLTRSILLLHCHIQQLALERDFSRTEQKATR